MGEERVEKLKEEWDSESLLFYKQTRLDCLTTKQKRVEDNDNEEDDGFDELERLLSHS